jgi:hypothetical protein
LIEYDFDKGKKGREDRLMDINSEMNEGGDFVFKIITTTEFGSVMKPQFEAIQSASTATGDMEEEREGK